MSESVEEDRDDVRYAMAIPDEAKKKKQFYSSSWTEESEASLQRTFYFQNIFIHVLLTCTSGERKGGYGSWGSGGGGGWRWGGGRCWKERKEKTSEARFDDSGGGVHSAINI